jgi:hypothetical protein
MAEGVYANTIKQIDQWLETERLVPDEGPFIYKPLQSGGGPRGM